jgi:hypothetical protein
MKAFKFNLLKTRCNYSFITNRAVFFSTKQKNRESLTDIQKTEITDIPDYKILIDKNLARTFFSINVPFYLSTLYLTFIKFHVPFIQDDFTIISRMSLCLINISHCIHSGFTFGIVSRTNSNVEIQSEEEHGKKLKKSFLIHLISSLSSFTITNLLLSGTVSTNLHLYFATLWFISGMQILTDYYGIKKKFLPYSLLKLQLYNFLAFTVSIVLLYGILKDKVHLLKRSGDTNRLENLKDLNDIILDEEEIISQENEEILKYNPEALEIIYNEKH